MPSDTIERRGALLIAMASFVILLVALAFEHIGGYRPCPLCLQERYAYYFATAVGLIAYFAPLRFVRVVLLLIAAGFVVNTGLAIYHSGAEWKFWPGPDTCGGGLRSLSAGGGLSGKLDTPAIRCDEAQWRLFGLSFAGWNAVISLALAAAALASIRRTRASH